MAARSPESSPDPENDPWTWDFIPHYRFNTQIIHEFLKSKWADYDEFFVEVCRSFPCDSITFSDTTHCS